VLGKISPAGEKLGKKTPAVFSGHGIPKQHPLKKHPSLTNIAPREAEIIYRSNVSMTFNLRSLANGKRQAEPNSNPPQIEFSPKKDNRGPCGGEPRRIQDSRTAPALAPVMVVIKHSAAKRKVLRRVFLPRFPVFM
jgi:hypothetical protein